MKIQEILEATGLTFMGSPCTKDCSGHRAGYKWGRHRGGAVATGKSQSFVNGTLIASDEINNRQRKPAQPAQPPQQGVPE